MKEYLSLQESLILEEFKACRERISKEIDAINSLETTMFVAAGAALGLAATITYQAVILTCLFVTLIGIYGATRYGAHRKIIRIHESYIIDKLESIIRNNANNYSSFGMMSDYEEKKSRHIDNIGGLSKSGSLKSDRYMFWFLLITLPIAIALFVYCNPEAANNFIKKGA